MLPYRPGGTRPSVRAGANPACAGPGAGQPCAAPRILRVTPSHEELKAELAELIAIPSVSADAEHAGDVAAAADWAAERIRRAGGEAEIVTPQGRPLTVGEVRASAGGEVPTVLAYAHFDVQPPDPLELWESEPYVLDERDGRLYARGVADDKTHLFQLLKTTELLAAEGALPVNVRFLLDSEEEIGGTSAEDWLAHDDRGADVAIVLDGGYATPELPSFGLGLRGLCYFHLEVRTGERDLHSGLFGGAALNANHALLQALSGVLAGPDGRLPEPLRAGIVPPSAEELAGWSLMPGGAAELADAGGRPMDAGALDAFYVRTAAEPAVDVHGIRSGSPSLVKTVLPVEAEANVSLRLAPGQSAAELAQVFETLLREAAPAGAELDLHVHSRSDGALVAPGSAAVKLAQDAFEQVLGIRPVLTRSGGSIPIVAKLGARGVPAIVTGFSLPSGRMHSPNENFPAAHLRLGIETLAAVLRGFARLS
jgi:acetylornithine deacetylase/succinyl-diaminopimelate desuccinylase-like protein